MGVVYRARQASLGRVVALKMILSGQLASAADIERFRMEARAAAGLQHPGIVAIHEIGDHDGRPYFSMDFVDGPSLAALVRDHPLAPAEAVRLARHCAQAVQYAHDRGVLHRDLKPGNILLGPDGLPRVTDFGLAKMTQADPGLTDTGAILGTPGYMPPEQASGGKVTAASDVYSLGAVLYELVTGRPPFRAATPLDTILQVIHEEPAPPRLLNPAISRDLETVILKCLAKEPARRYASAAELADDLHAVAEGRPVRARRPGLAERIARFLGRHRRTAFIAASAVLLTALAVLGAWGVLAWRHSATLGHLTIENETLPQRAEVRSWGQRSLAVPVFLTPTIDPAALPEGRYEATLSGASRLSERFAFAFQAGAQRHLKLDLSARLAFEPLTVRQPVMFAPGWRGHRILCGDTQQRIAAHSGEDGRREWVVDPQGALTQHGLQLVQSRPNLILAGGTGIQGLMAVSPEGKILWKHQLTPDLPKGEKAFTAQSGSRLLGPPLSHGGRAHTLTGCPPWHVGEKHTPRTAFLDAIDEATGERKWRYTLPPEWFDQKDRFYFEESSPEAVGPVLGRLAGRDVLLVLAGRRLVALDPEAGAPLGPPRALSHVHRGFPPRALGERLLTMANEGGIWSLVLTDVATGKEAWRRRCIEQPAAVDVQSAGPSLLVRTEEGVELLDAATGEVRWSLGELPPRFGRMSVSRFIAGPDLDGDGAPDVFRAFTVTDNLRRRELLAVEAVSGKDGSRLWLRLHPVKSRQLNAVQPLAWWATGRDGWPMLVVAGERPAYVLEASTGEIAHRLDDWHGGTVLDLDGDGYPELIEVRSIGPIHGDRARITAIRGRPPEMWRWAGQASTIGDLDGDGIPDLATTGPSQALSGAGLKPLLPSLPKDVALRCVLDNGSLLLTRGTPGRGWLALVADGKTGKPGPPVALGKAYPEAAFALPGAGLLLTREQGSPGEQDTFGLVLIDAATGEEAGRTERFRNTGSNVMSRYLPPQMIGEDAFLLVERPYLRGWSLSAHDRATGKLLWRKELVDQHGWSLDVFAPSALGKQVAFRRATREGKRQIVLAQARTGEERVLHEVKDGYLGDPCLFLRDGKPLAAFQTGSDDAVSVVICDLAGKELLRHPPPREWMGGFGNDSTRPLLACTVKGRPALVGIQDNQLVAWAADAKEELWRCSEAQLDVLSAEIERHLPGSTMREDTVIVRDGLGVKAWGIAVDSGKLVWRIGGAGTIRAFSSEPVPWVMAEDQAGWWCLARATPSEAERGAAPRQVIDDDLRPLPLMEGEAREMLFLLGLLAACFVGLVSALALLRGKWAAFIPVALYVALLALLVVGTWWQNRGSWLPGERWDFSGWWMLPLGVAALLGVFSLPAALLWGLVEWWRSRRRRAA
jgi:hypothetical protein